jgi:putative transcriptional regulator
MKDKDFAELKAGMTEALEHARGKVTLKTKNVPMPGRATAMRPAEIARLRRRLHASQGVFALWLNVSRDTAISWETGRRKPSGAALRLLQVVDIAPDVLPRLVTVRKRKRPSVATKRRSRR